MGMADAPRVPCATPEEWRDWLEQYHADEGGAWLVLWRPATGRGRLSYDDAILEALCVGWIDGQSKPLDDERSMLWFTRRSPRSAWSATNKARVARLESEGRMRPAGRALVEAARANGRWTVLDGVEEGVEPPDLASALDADATARAAWDGFTLGRRKLALTAIALAARPETRAARIARTVADAARGIPPG